MEQKPKVSVLVPVYKTEPGFLREMISSVLRQTLRDFELVILDDCPSDSREGVVREFSDPRIVYAANERNLGITPSRNRLLDMARGEYLAILDHDDVCRADRLEREAAYLDAHPECGLVTSFTRHFPVGGLWVRPVTDRAIRVGLASYSSMSHSAAMMRASVLRESGVRYEEEYSPSEDYRLFSRLMGVTKFHCIPEALLDYRVHSCNTTGASQSKMIAAAMKVRDDVRARYPELRELAEGRGEAPLRIVVSGGWSYGNLGDDAILDATARLLWRNLPEADVVWLAYDEQFARDSALVPPAGVRASLHRFMDRGWSFWMLQTMWRSAGYALWPSLVQWVYGKLFRRAQIRRALKRDRVADPSDVFKGAKLYIMSGGGYFNQWPTKFDACIRELEIAHENGCGVVLVGQSVGPFSEEQKARLKAALRPTDVICVRDGESAAELESLGFKAKIAPDLALGFPKRASGASGLLTVVPGSLADGMDVLLADQLSAFLDGRDYRLRIVQTCTVWSDVLSARNLRRRLRERGIEAEVILPRTYLELCAAVEGSELVVSRRMHAMIIGWRGGSDVFALKLSRKLVGFLGMIGRPDNFCRDDSWGQLSERLAAAVRRGPADVSREALAAEVDAAFRDCLEQAGMADEIAASAAEMV